ncbi:MAG: 3-hydroxyacyl-CoA dehydrogenase family protein, partial [Calditrichaeota bacterium]
MTLDERLQNVAVLGAGGKMGSGITLLLAREMTLLKLRAGGSPRLFAMDVRPEALDGLRQYLSGQARKFAQKNSETLKDLLGTDDVDQLAARFEQELLSVLEPVTSLEAVSPARMVFEAILENVDLKVKVFSQLRDLCSEDTFFFSNTSSIPIGLLNERAGLGGRLVGFHFYNPPAVQKLVELILPAQVHPELPELCQALARRLGKIVIPSNDVAGFIGNGHFMRDGLHAIQEAERLQKEGFSFQQSIYMMNRVAQDFLIRPMGIFQLMDYVGLDVFQSILAIMNPHFPEENLHSELIDGLVSRGVKG